MNKVTIFASLATHRPMIVLTRNCSIITNIDNCFRLVKCVLFNFFRLIVVFFKGNNLGFDTLDVLLVFEFKLCH